MNDTWDLEIFVPGPAQGKARHRSGQGRNYTPKKTVDAERIIAWEAQKAMAGRPRLSGPIEIWFAAAYHYPASWPARKKARTYWKTTKPDGDNIEKLLSDALNGVAWVDDASIVLATKAKFYTTGPEGLTVKIRGLL